MTKFRKFNRPTGHRMSMLRFAHDLHMFQFDSVYISVFWASLINRDQDNGLAIGEAWADWNHGCQGKLFSCTVEFRKEDLFIYFF